LIRHISLSLSRSLAQILFGRRDQLAGFKAHATRVWAQTAPIINGEQPMGSAASASQLERERERENNNNHK